MKIDQNGQLDSCDPDYDTDGIPDGYDTICDSDGDGIPDEWDIDQTGGLDCDSNGEDDLCQSDCDDDGLIDPDNDDDNDGIPDVCDASRCSSPLTGQSLRHFAGVITRLVSVIFLSITDSDRSRLVIILALKDDGTILVWGDFQLICWEWIHIYCD